MSTKLKTPCPICHSAQLVELGSHGFHVSYRGAPFAAILVRFRGVAYAYLNQCLHMPRPLDGEEPRVFDESGVALRCTMHGITYQPETGACLSEICAGKALTPVRVEERDNVIYLTDRRAVLTI